MAAAEAAVQQAFAGFTSALERETRALKQVSVLQRAGGSEAAAREVQVLEGAVSRVEAMLDELEEFADKENAVLRHMQSVCDQCVAQKDALRSIDACVPHFMRSAADAQAPALAQAIPYGAEPAVGAAGATALANTSCSTINSASTAGNANTQQPHPAPNKNQQQQQQQQQNRRRRGPPAPALVLVTREELQSVPKTTRGRVSLDQLHKALQSIHQAFLDKIKVFQWVSRKARAPRSMQQALQQIEDVKVDEHGNRVFLTEAEIRATLSNHGDSTYRALVHTLRYLDRVQVIRGHSETTYVMP